MVKLSGGYCQTFMSRAKKRTVRREVFMYTTEYSKRIEGREMLTLKFMMNEERQYDTYGGLR